MDLIKRFKALSDMTRLRLFFILQRYELNVNEMVRVIDMIQSGVSRHLRILSESGLLTARKEGSFTYYSTAENTAARQLLDVINHEVDDQAFCEKELRAARLMIESRQNRTRRFFSTVAPQWDHLKKEVLGEFDLNAHMIEKTPLSGKIADLGCGTGALIRRIVCEDVKEIIGIDSSPEMLKQARIKLSDLPGVQLRLGELEHLPMKNHEIDTALMNMVLHHISQPRAAILEVFRVVRPGGTFVLSDFEQHSNERIKEIIGGEWLGFEKDKIKSWLTHAGFEMTSITSYTVTNGLTVNIYTAQKQMIKEKT